MTIVPRWEWRTFGAPEHRFASLTPDRFEDSDELYLVAPGRDASVKVRDGRMDVKHLLDVDENGLELWMPVMKAPFPLAAADAGTVLKTLCGHVPRLGSAEYTIDDLLAAAADARVVEVHKRRARYTIGACRAELTELRTDVGTTSTIAVESEEPLRVIATVRALGLASRPNTCVARGLKALAGIGARRFAVIDVGTNSVKFHVGERAADGAWRKLVDRAEVTRLGEGLDETGRLSPQAIARTAEVIAAMAVEARQHRAEAIAAVGTAGMRIAPNAADLVAAAGMPVEVISGDDEARLAYRAATSSLGPLPGSLVVFDTGGGSSQFSLGSADRVDERFSVDVGAVRFTESYGLDGVTPAERLEAALAAISDALARLSGRPRPDVVIGMGGAVTNLTAVMHGLEAYDPDVVHCSVLDRDEIDRQIELYRTRDRERRRAIVGLQPNRADVILAGACIVRTVLIALGAESLTVSDRGLRHGVLADRFPLARPTPERLVAPSAG